MTAGAVLDARREPVIRLRRLVKRFAGHTALDGIDLELGGEQIVGVVGPDGAGKTTLIRALAGLLEIEAEQASVLGFDLRSDPIAIKERIGYVPQSFSLQRELSVIENLRFTARLHRIAPGEREARSRELLEHTGLAPFADRPAGALSGGMKQKLAVASALLHRPPLLLLDEPTAGVDVLARAEIWAMLAAERRRALVLISTSYLDEAARADRLVYLDGGRLTATGTPEELRTGAGIELYRVWSEDSRAVARAARALPYVDSAYAAGGFARVEIRRERAPAHEQVLHDLRALGAAPCVAERVPPDMQSVLLALARARHS